MPETLVRLAETLHHLRRQSRLSQEQLANLSGVSKQQIGNLERSKDPRSGKAPLPRPDTLRRLADALAINSVTGQVHQDRADDYYNQLAAAAGYFPAGGDGVSRLSPRDRAQALLAKNPRAATAFEALPNDMDDADVDALARHLEVFADLLRRRRA